MSKPLLALSHKAELGLHTQVVADLQATAGPLGIAMLIAGAFARDLHLHYAWGVPVQRHHHATSQYRTTRRFARSDEPQEP